MAKRKGRFNRIGRVVGIGGCAAALSMVAWAAPAGAATARHASQHAVSRPAGIIWGDVQRPAGIIWGSVQRPAGVVWGNGTHRPAGIIWGD